MLSGNIQQLLGIPLALLGVVLLALGSQLQNAGVKKASRGQTGLNWQYLWLLLCRPSWLMGTSLLGLAVAAQLASLVFAPLIVVQPLGALAIALSVILNARQQRIPLSNDLKRPVIFCIAGVSVFVLVAASFAQEKVVNNLQVIIVILFVFLALVIFGGLIKLNRLNAVFCIVGTGILYGLVVSLADIVINRLQHENFEWLTFLAFAALLTAGGMGFYLAQKAHASASPDLVVAGLTVIDPLVAVAVGALVLGEIDNLPFWAFFLAVLGALSAVYGVWRLGRHHAKPALKPDLN